MMFPNSQPVHRPGCEGVIFPAGAPYEEDMLSYMRYSSDYENPLSDWTPSLETVNDAESRIAEFVQGAASHIAAKLDQSARQYFGVSRAGRRYLYINCFPADIRTDWRSGPVLAIDGGDSFFQLLYDPESSEFCELTINGEA